MTRGELDKGVQESEELKVRREEGAVGCGKQHTKVGVVAAGKRGRRGRAARAPPIAIGGNGDGGEGVRSSWRKEEGGACGEEGGGGGGEGGGEPNLLGKEDGAAAAAATGLRWKGEGSRAYDGGNKDWKDAFDRSARFPFLSAHEHTQQGGANACERKPDLI